MTQNLDLKQLEPYLLRSDDFSFSPDALIPGTETCLYAQLLHEIQKDPNSSNTENLFKEFKKLYPHSPLLERLQLRKDLLTYDSLSEKGEKQKILSSITKSIYGTDLVQELEKKAMAYQAHHNKVQTNQDFSTLNPKDIDISEVITKAHHSEKYFKDLEPTAYHLLDLRQLNHMLIELVLNGYAYDFGTEEIKKLSEIEKDKEMHGNDLLTGNLNKIFSKLTAKQLAVWLEIDPDIQNRSIFVENYVKKHFSEEIDFEYSLIFLSREQITEEKLTTRLNGLQRIWAYVKQLPKIYYSLQKNLLIEILKTAFVLQTPDLMHFLYYLTNFHTKKPELSGSTQAYFDFYQHDHVTGLSQRDMIEYYLLCTLKDSSDISPFKNYFEHTELERLFAKSKLYFDPDSSNNNKYTAILGGAQSEILKEKTKFKIVAMKTHANDKPSYKIMHKNIEEFTLNVYSVDLHSYFLKYHTVFDPNTTLAGIYPTQTRTIKLPNSDPFKINFYNLELEDVLQDKGFFVVELLAKTHKIRQIIKRGNLHYIHRCTAAGNLIMVFNSDLTSCQNACVYYENKKYESNAKGQIFFPYSNRYTGQIYVLLEGNGIYEIVPIEQRNEDYQLECEFYCDKHSLVAGNEAKILLAPRLTVSGFSTTLGVLKAARISANVVNENGVSSSLEEKDYDLSQKDFITWTFRVPPKLKQLNLSLKAKVWNTSQNRWVDLSVSKTYEIENSKEINKKIVICDLEMIYTKEGHVLKVIGKNGETHPDIDIEVSLKHRYLREPIKLLFRTDAAGRVVLGELEDIESVTANIVERLQMAGSVPRTWYLDRDFSGYVAEIVALEGESARIYYCKGEEQNYRILKWSKYDNCLLEVIRDSHKFSNNGYLEVSGLKEGSYLLVDITSKFKVKINIIQGRRVPDYGFLLCHKTQTLYENPFKNQNISEVGDVEIENNLQIQLAKWDDNTKVHVVAMPFWPSSDSFLDLVQSLRNPCILSGFGGLVEDRQPDLDYSWLYNGEIDDVTRYVNERRKKNKVLGNIFEKPTYLLNPEESKTSKKNVADVERLDRKANNIDPKSRLVFKVEVKKYPGCEWEDFQTFQTIKKFTPKKTLENIFLREFVKNPSIIYENLLPNKDGVISIDSKELNLKKFAGVWILVSGKGCYSAQYIPLQDYEMEINDLGLRNLLDPTKYYKEITQEDVKKKGEKTTITDITNAEIQIIDTVEKLFKCQKEILNSVKKHSNFSLVDMPEGYEGWEFLGRWQSLSMDQKQAYYDKYASHELNFFLFMKDQDFFNNIVKPFLSSKIEKTLVDEFLLGQDLSSYAQPHKLEKLNYLELALVVWNLVKRGKVEEAQAIYDLAKMQENSLKKYTQVEGEKIFEIIISLKSLDKAMTLENQIKKQAEEVEKERAGEIQEAFAIDGGLSSMQDLMPAGFLMGKERFQSLARSMKDEISKKVMLADDADMQCLRAEEACLELKSVEKKKKTTLGLFAGVRKKKSAVPRMEKSLKLVKELDKPEEDSFCEEEAQEPAPLDYLVASDVIEGKKKQEVYEEVEKTKEYAEIQYYNVKQCSQFKGLVSLNFFWLDFMNHIITKPDEPFLTNNFKYAINSYTELIAALALVDLPFKEGQHLYQKNNSGMDIIADSNLIIFFKEIAQAEKVDFEDDILILQRFFEPNDRYTFTESNKKVEKYVNKFYAHRVYGAQIVITNLTKTTYECQILYQIPQGCLPLLQEYTQKTLKFTVRPNTSVNTEYFFYSPAVQESYQLPLYILINKEPAKKLSANKFTFHDLKTQEKNIFLEINERNLELSTHEELIQIFRYVLDKPDEFAPKRFVMDYIKTKVYDNTLFNDIITICHERFLYLDDIWKQGFYHVDDLLIQESLGMKLATDEAARKKVGSNINTKLVSSDNDEEIFSYFVSSLNSQRLVNIITDVEGLPVNDPPTNHYKELLNYILEKGKVTDTEKLILAIFFIHQVAFKNLKKSYS